MIMRQFPSMVTKFLTGSMGGCLLTNSLEDANKARKWSTQSRENAPWYQHEEVGYNYRMSNIVAGIIRGQYPYLEEHIRQKKAVFERYREGLKGLPVTMNLSCRCGAELLAELHSDRQRGYVSTGAWRPRCTLQGRARKELPTEILEI